MKLFNGFMLSLAIVAISLTGCSKKKDLKPEDSVVSSTGDTAKDVSQNDVDSGKADSDSGNAMGLQTINFPFDSSEIVGENKEKLNQNVAIMKKTPSLAVQIEGHCDERGGIQYNLGLGERRANAIIQQMVLAGIGKNRLTLISMGKEKPLVQGSNEEAWAKNRRGNYVITSK